MSELFTPDKDRQGHIWVYHCPESWILASIFPLFELKHLRHVPDAKCKMKDRLTKLSSTRYGAES